MYAYLMEGAGQLGLGTVPDPVCGPDEVVLETEAVSICSTDVSYFRGHLFPPSWPIIPGHEYVGRVVETGPRTAGGLALGDRVCYWGQTDFGGMAEYRVIRPLFAHQMGVETSWYTERNFYDADQAAAVIVPDSLPGGLATIVEPLTSVLRSLLTNAPRPGDVCVVLGAGPSALLAVQVLRKHLGAGAVLVVDRDDARLQTALQCGATTVFNCETQGAEIADFAREHHDQFADYVFDALPYIAPVEIGSDPRQMAMELLRPHGDYVVYGASGKPQLISTWMILAKGLNVRATPFDVRAFPMLRSARVCEVALGLISSGLVDARPLVTSQIPLLDEVAVRAAFADYGSTGSLKASMSTRLPAGFGADPEVLGEETRVPA